ncbi:type II secretion system protein [Candidatus Absconditicoccus praedator]|uniref:type II secretion system protein n=1 Tax=Candidatus Absconditicoccus praedator TaxID=2735562 RepID=UPI001E463005|nr:type II secretion system protein [Candidatus Absconditicoccus praedator]UFX83056.1 type II secretion system protein [Candidatus Absconditicoccus praedator]
MKKAFTLIEVLVVTVIIGSLFLMVINLYFRMMETRVDVEARQSLIDNSYYMLERINTLVSNFTIDYEEYFNRKVVGCSGDGGENFSWGQVGDRGYCDDFTGYGSKNSIDGYDEDSNWQLYYCSSDFGDSSSEITNNEDEGGNYVFEEDNSGRVRGGEGCWREADEGKQSFGQYEKQFMDVGTDVSGAGGIVGDHDDLDVGLGPISVADNENTQELYLISDTGDERLFIRRKKVDSMDDTGRFDNLEEDDDIANLYTLQMLRLRGFDAGEEHDFDSDGTYDGQINTWACDYGQGFECNGSAVGDPYNNYKLPEDEDDGWVNIFGDEITVTDWNLEIYPTKDPNLSWNDDDTQINPYVKINLQTKLYAGAWAERINPSILQDYQLNLQTTFNIRSNY